MIITVRPAGLNQLILDLCRNKDTGSWESPYFERLDVAPQRTEPVTFQVRLNKHQLSCLVTVDLKDKYERLR